MMCMWLSIRPGTTRRPFRSTCFVLGPASAMTLRSSATATKREARIAIAWACGFARSSVVILPLKKTISGASLIVWASPRGDEIPTPVVMAPMPATTLRRSGLLVIA